MGVRNMQGVSAYLEYVGPRGRKRKKNCIYYNNGICNCNKSAYYLLKCGGRCACIYYDDSEEVRENYYTYSKDMLNIDNKNIKHNNSNKNSFKNNSYENDINNRKIKVEDIDTKKKYLVQLVPKDKENENACMFFIDSDKGRMFSKCKVGEEVMFSINGENHRFIVKEIK